MGGGFLFFVNGQFGIVACIVVAFLMYFFLKPEFRKKLLKGLLVFAALAAVYVGAVKVYQEYDIWQTNRENERMHAEAAEANKHFREIFAEKGIPVTLSDRELYDKYNTTHYRVKELRSVWVYATTEDLTIVDVAYQPVTRFDGKDMNANDIDFYPEQVGAKKEVTSSTVYNPPGHWYEEGKRIKKKKY